MKADMAWSGSNAGTMADGSKRLREDRVEKANDMTYWSPVEPMLPPPLPSAAASAGLGYPVQSLFPEGIKSIEQWGATLFAFGKFKDSKCYEEVANSSQAEMVSYRAYCTSHYANGSAGLKDFVSYLRACNMGKTSEMTIPGSHLPRVFKKKT